MRGRSWTWYFGRAAELRADERERRSQRKRSSSEKSHRRSVDARLQHRLGNRGVQRLLAEESTGAGGGEVKTAKADAGETRSNERDATTEETTKMQTKGEEKTDEKAGEKKSADDMGSPISGATEQFYDVTGDLSALKSQFKFQNGERYASETRVDVGLEGRLTPRKKSGQLVVGPISWKAVSATVELPHWTGYDTASDAERKEWARFVRRTRVHEQQHVDRAKAYLRNLSADMRWVRASDRDKLQAKLTALRDRVGRAVQNVHDEYDAETNHGATQGATLLPP